MRKFNMGKQTMPSPEATEALRATFLDSVSQPDRQKRTEQIIGELENHRKHNGFSKIVAAAYGASKE